MVLKSSGLCYPWVHLLYYAILCVTLTCLTGKACLNEDPLSSLCEVMANIQRNCRKVNNSQRSVVCEHVAEDPQR